jgi:hypothetical protein
MAEALECMPIFTFGLWPTPSHKERFSSLVFELGCGTHPLQSVSQCPLKEQNAAGIGAAELSSHTL